MIARRNAALLFALMLVAWCVPERGQIAGLTPSSTPASAQPSAPPDALGRENPRGGMIGFIKAAQEERYNIAVQYFQPVTGRRRPAPDEEEELASQLLTILNQKFAGPLGPKSAPTSSLC